MYCAKGKTITFSTVNGIERIYCKSCRKTLHRSSDLSMNLFQECSGCTKSMTSKRDRAIINKASQKVLLKNLKTREYSSYY